MNIQPWKTINFKDLFPTTSLPNNQIKYGAPNDFGKVIHELLFAKSVAGTSDRFLSDVRLVAEIEGFNVRESRDMCPVRDYRVMISNDEFLSPNVSDQVKQAADRCYKRSLFCKNHAHLLRSDKKHGHVGLGAVGVEGKAIVLRNAAPSDQYPSELPHQAKNQSARIYFEGGNLFQITGLDGKKRVIFGEDNVTVTHQLMRLTGLFKNPSDYLEGKIPEMIGEIGKRIAQDISSAVVERTLGKMASMGLVLQDFTVTAETTAIAVNYLAQKQFIEQIMIPKELKVAASQMIHLPQIDYHEDLLMTPGPNGTILLQDYKQSVLLLERVKRELTDKSDRELIDLFIFTTKEDGGRVKGVMEKAKQALEQAGLRVIPTPGAFFAPPTSEMKLMVNFLNAITGFSPKTNHYYYIVGGTSVGLKLGALLMDAYAQFLQSLCPDKINLYYVGRDLRKPTDFSLVDHVLNNRDAMMGVHCLSLETKIEAL